MFTVSQSHKTFIYNPNKCNSKIMLKICSLLVKATKHLYMILIQLFILISKHNHESHY